jgi:hypothetical protein
MLRQLSQFKTPDSPTPTHRTASEASYLKEFDEQGLANV